MIACVPLTAASHLVHEHHHHIILSPSEASYAGTNVGCHAASLLYRECVIVHFYSSIQTGICAILLPFSSMNHPNPLVLKSKPRSNLDMLFKISEDETLWCQTKAAILTVSFGLL